MVLNPQIITETSLWLILVLLVLLLNYLLFKSLYSRAMTSILATACIALGVTHIIENLDYKSFIDSEQLSVLEKVSNIRSRLEGLVQTDLEIGKALVLYIKSKKFDFTVDELNNISQSIIESDPRIRHIAVAENLVVNYVYPYEQNKKAIGLDYQQNAEQWPTIEHAIISKKTIIAGPVNLVQGGVAFIGRLPVFTNDDSTDSFEKLWGLVSVVIDQDELFTAAGLYNDNELNIAIRGVDALGENGAVFFGNNDLFSQLPIIQNIKLPEGSWQIAAIPTHGWPTSSPTQIKIRLIVLSFFLLSAFFIIFRARQHLIQQKTHQELRDEIAERTRSEDRYRQLFEHSSDGIFLITNNLISDCNHQLLKMLDLSMDSILNRSWPDISSAPQKNGETADFYYNKLTRPSSKISYGKETLLAEWIHVTPKNNTVILEITFTPIHTMEQPTLLATCKDVSSRKRMEKEQKELTNKLFHSEKLKAIGQLAGGIAHDFNNILTAISGYAQLAKLNIQQDTELHKLPFFLDEVIKAGDRAKILVQQLFSFSRGKNIQSKIISPIEIIEETLTLLEATIPTSIKLLTHFTDNQYKIDSDPTQFQQIVLNLIVNSRDAITEQKGEIHITLEKVSIRNQTCSSCSELVSGEFLQLTIADSGMGIHETDIEHIFEPFYSTKHKSTGAGLGLSVVHGIVHATNGHIMVESIIGVGTKIKLAFPILSNPEAEEIYSAEQKNIEVKNVEGQILIVDDETAITQLFEDLLSTMGIQSVIFNDPRKAFEYFQEHGKKLTLIITDQTMPDMKGSELVQQIRQLNTDIPIILCSGHSDIVDKQELKSLGINMFLNKPVNLNELSELIYSFHS